LYKTSYTDVLLHVCWRKKKSKTRKPNERSRCSLI